MSCILHKVCGCGDEIQSAEGDKRRESQSNETRVVATSSDTATWCHNFGFKRQGVLKDLDIIDVHPAGKEDPTQLGMFGTESLRGSKDTYNQQLSFSVVSRDVTSAQGYSTLDIECDCDNVYYTLLQGFQMLLELADQHKKNKQEHPEDADALKPSSMFRKHWGSERRRRKVKRRLDPVAQLFEPSDNLDAMRALQVGGGFLPVGRGVQSMVLSSTSRNLTLSPVKSSSTGGVSAGDVKAVPPAQFLGGFTHCSILRITSLDSFHVIQVGVRLVLRFGLA